VTFEDRLTVRLGRDEHVRALIDWRADPRCAECGGELADDFGRPCFTLDCETCVNRRRKRTARALGLYVPRPEPGFLHRLHVRFDLDDFSRLKRRAAAAGVPLAQAMRDGALLYLDGAADVPVSPRRWLSRTHNLHVKLPADLHTVLLQRAREAGTDLPAVLRAGAGLYLDSLEPRPRRRPRAVLKATRRPVCVG